jgi:transposase
LITGTSISDAAKQANIHERTLYRWLQEEEFQRAVRRARRLSLTQLATHLQHMAGRAAGALDEIMVDKNATSSSRVNAARYAMDMFFKAATLEDIMERLITMEKGQQEENNW